METLRCPTCLTLLLDGGEKRCPACHSRLRKRSAPIVLGESTRITNRPLLPFEREIRDRAESSETEERWRRPVAAESGAATNASSATPSKAEVAPNTEPASR